MTKYRIWAILVVAVSILLAFYIYKSELSGTGSHKLKLGLDLRGGTHLVYRADISKIPDADVSSSMNALRDVVERRLNIFGASEPVVQVEQGGVLGGNVREQKLIVELPGIKNIEEAKQTIGQTPHLEFRLVNEEALKAVSASSTKPLTQAEIDKVYVPTGLDGSKVKSASLTYNNQTSEPIVSLEFNEQGGTLFAKITKENVGKRLAIFLDGDLKESPVIREEILGGRAQISGGFTQDTAKKLVRDLNYGALPVAITLEGSQTIDASLGGDAVHASVKAGAWAFLIIALFLIIWYRLPGLIATIALGVYVVINLILFKFLPGSMQVTLTAAGIAGFILSIGMAVDANILIFERMKEELRSGKNLDQSIKEGFSRAWLSIRDSNLSSIITALILFFFASTSVVKGFAYVFLIGVITSMLTAITISRTLLIAIQPKGNGKLVKFLFGNGFTK